MVHREIKYVPGFFKIIDEILVNAADNKVSSVRFAWRSRAVLGAYLLLDMGESMGHHVRIGSKLPLFLCLCWS